MTGKREVYVCKCEGTQCRVSFPQWVTPKVLQKDCPDFPPNIEKKKPNWKLQTRITK